MIRVAFCVSGRGALVRAALAQAAPLGVQPVQLVMEIKAASDLEAVGRAHGVPTVRLDPTDRAAFDTALTDVLAAADPDLIVLTFDRVLAPALVQRFQGRIINVHPALLPAFPGTRAVERLLASGARFGGATIHLVTEAVDAGPVIAQTIVGTIPDEDAADYGRRMYETLEPMFLDVLRWFSTDRVERREDGSVVVRGATYGGVPTSPTDAV